MKTSRRSLNLPVLILLCAAGCGGNGHPPLFAVSGQVFLDQKPATDAVVWLHPIDATTPGKCLPHGKVDKDGDFEISTYALKDGAPAGRYRVAIFWRLPPVAGDEDGDSLIPDRYMNPATSNIPVIDIDQEPVVVPPIHLTQN